ncbi:TetR family transcriptional regulator [Nocardioides sp. NPDC101246]|uniref:TetR family transcriptional regulator n=1 Tax=Nocardioides sp. NPDC101246 TaxID=3364336 RepID=UPI0037F39A28
MTTDSAPSGRREDGKAQISAVAMELFLARGYDNVTVEAVAAEAGVSRRTVFRYFPSKGELPFPDHAERRSMMEKMFADLGSDPIEDVFEVTEAVLRDFLKHPELVLSRYALTRQIPLLAEREILEHEKYVAITRRHLSTHLEVSTPSFVPQAVAALIDGVHRSALSNWIRSHGKSDAIAELLEGFAWIRDRLGSSGLGSTSPRLLVLPDNPRVRRALRDLAEVPEEPAAGHGELA